MTQYSLVALQNIHSTAGEITQIFNGLVSNNVVVFNHHCISQKKVNFQPLLYKKDHSLMKLHSTHSSIYMNNTDILVVFFFVSRLLVFHLYCFLS